MSRDGIPCICSRPHGFKRKKSSHLGVFFKSRVGPVDSEFGWVRVLETGRQLFRVRVDLDLGF